MIKDIWRIVSNCKLNRSEPYPEPTENHPTKVEGPFVHLGLDIKETYGIKIYSLN